MGDAFSDEDEQGSVGNDFVDRYPLKPSGYRLL
jgi:hypothetical protein